jgi:NifU-like protein involved in Fe-S cluster formation
MVHGGREAAIEWAGKVFDHLVRRYVPVEIEETDSGVWSTPSPIRLARERGRKDLAGRDRFGIRDGLISSWYLLDEPDQPRADARAENRPEPVRELLQTLTQHNWLGGRFPPVLGVGGRPPPATRVTAGAENGRLEPLASPRECDLLEQFLADARRGPAPDGAFSGSAGGAPCGDLVRISLSVDDSLIERVSFEREGCAASAAAAAAVAELAEGSSVLEAARIGPDEVEAELGGLAPTHRHAVVLAADALHRALSD